MDFAGSGVALIIGADEMVLAVVLVALAGAEVQLGSAVGAVEKTGEHAGSSCLCRPAFVLPQFLYPFPLSLLTKLNHFTLSHYGVPVPYPTLKHHC